MAFSIDNCTTESSIDNNRSKEEQLLELCDDPTPNPNRVNKLRRLIDKGVDLNCTNQYGDTPLILTCWKNQTDDLYDCVDLLTRLPIVQSPTRYVKNGKKSSSKSNHKKRSHQKIKLKRNTKPVDINFKDSSGLNALLLICRYNTDPKLINCISLLLDRGIDVNAVNNEGWNCLHFLCRYYPHSNLIDIVQLLVDRWKIELNRIVQPDDWNALLFLCRNYAHENIGEIVRLMIRWGVDCQRTDKDGWNCLLYVCRYYPNNNVLLDLIRLLLNEGKVDINAATNANGTNALHFLIKRHYTEKGQLMPIVQLMIDRGIDVSAVSRCSGLNAFLCLCRYYAESDLLDLIRLILERHADSIHKVDRDDWSALHFLLRFNTENEHLVEIIRYLIVNGISVQLLNNNNSNTICFLFRNSTKPNTLDIARLLIDAGVDVDMKHKFGWNALQILCRHYPNENILQIIELMIESGADLHLTNINGSNALMLLCRYYSGANLIDVVRLLIERGVDVCAVNNNGWSALLFLSFYYTGPNLVDIIRLLIQKNKDVVRHRSNAGLMVPDALSRNWSCQLHSIVQNLKVDWPMERSPYLMEVVALGAARIGCVKTACRLMQRIGTHNVVDIFDRDVFTYLSYVIHLSFSLCSLCGPIVSQADRDMYDYHRRWFRSKETRLMSAIAEHHQGQPTAVFIAEFDNKTKYKDNTLFRDHSMDDVICLPDHADWLRILDAWHSASSAAAAEEEANVMEEIQLYLDRHSHPYHDQLSVGSCYWCRVAIHIDAYLYRLMQQVREWDPLFDVERIVPYGSSAERTDILRPEEFDRGVVLRDFKQSPTNPLQVVYTGDYDQSLRGQPINSSSLLEHFEELIEATIDRINCVHIFSPQVTYGETCVTIHFLYRGEKPPAFTASVDITIVVQPAASSPCQKSSCPRNLPPWCRMIEPSIDCEFYLVPYRRNGSQWRLSYPTLERDTLLQTNETVIRVYQLLKLLVALQHSKEERSVEIRRKFVPSSYAIKTCLLQYMKTVDPCTWSSSGDEGLMLTHAVGVLRHYPLRSAEMFSFFDEEIKALDVTQSSQVVVSEIIAKLSQFIQT